MNTPQNPRIDLGSMPKIDDSSKPSKPSKIGTNGIKLIKEFESFRSKPYLCPANIPTIGYGNTFYEDGTKVTLHDKPIDEIRATKLLYYELDGVEKRVSSYVQSNIDQNQFDALVSFAYNVGYYNLKISTLLKKININPNDESIYKEFLRWNKADGTHNGIDDDGDGLIDESGEKQKLSGLTRRRIAEATLYFK